MTVVRVAAPLRKQVVAQLREDIFRSEFKPGERLLERDLCERYDVSRTVIREALRQLESEDLIAIVPNHGPVVARLTRVEAAELFEVRAVLEPMICKLFAQRASEDERLRLSAAAKSIRSVLADGRSGDWSAPDAYYEALLDGCGNNFLASIFRSSQARVRLTRGPALSEPGAARASMQELLDVVDAVLSGDLQAVQQASDRHVKQARARVLARIEAD